jgi:hypothetical protein
LLFLLRNNEAEATMSKNTASNPQDPELPPNLGSSPAQPANSAAIPGGESVRGEVAGCPTGLPAAPPSLTPTEEPDDRDNPLRPDKLDVEPLEGRQEGGRE